MQPSDHGDYPITRDLSRLPRRAVGLAVDHGDSSDIFPVIPCYLPVRSLLGISSVGEESLWN